MSEIEQLRAQIAPLQKRLEYLERRYAILAIKWTRFECDVHRVKWIGTEEDKQVALEMLQAEWPRVTFAVFEQDVSQNG